MTIQDSTLMDNVGSWGKIAFRADGDMITLTNCHFPESYITDNGADLWYVTVNTPKPSLKSKFIMKAKQDGGLETSYIYDRVGSANYAISESRANFIDFPVGPNVVPERNVGGRYYYNTLQHLPPGSTGSAYFMSEAMHVGGGLPMVVGTGSGCLLEPPSGQDYLSVGWRVCCEESSNGRLGATGTWRTHDRLLDVFALFGATARGSAPVVSYDSVQPYFDFANGSGTWKPNQYEAGRAYLHGLFASAGPLAHINTGDYIFVDLGNNGYHGFMVVGWGEARSPVTSMNSQVGTDPTSFSIMRRNNGLEIPYVTDFCYSVRDNNGRWLQDPRPRPFYSSAAEIFAASLNRDDTATPQDENIIFYGYSVSQYVARLRDDKFSPFVYPDVDKTRPNWRFIHLPDSITLNAQQIYTIPSGC